jgi:DNA-binding XRE family transcriptional regulator
MTLARSNRYRNLSLRKTLILRPLNNIFPVHASDNRTGGSGGQADYGGYRKINCLGARVRAARKSMRLTQVQLGILAGLSQTTISDIERGRNIRTRDIVPLAQALHVTAEHLMAPCAESDRRTGERRDGDRRAGDRRKT